MFKAIKTAHKLGSMGVKWAATTGVDPGDKGQLVTLASQYVSNIGLDPEDAWLTAMVHYINGMPHQNSKQLLAAAMLRFLDTNEGKIPLSAICILGARGHAEKILGMDNYTDAPNGFESRKVASLAASAIDYILENDGVSTLVGGSLVLDKELRVSFRTGRMTLSSNIRAAVALGDLEAAKPFREFHSIGISDMSMYSLFVDPLVYEAMLALEKQLSEAPQTRSPKPHQPAVAPISASLPPTPSAARYSATAPAEDFHRLSACPPTEAQCPACGNKMRISSSPHRRNVFCVHCSHEFSTAP